MNPSNVYYMCRDFVLDSQLPLEHKNLILGWIRSRDLERLSACPDYIPGAYQDLDLCRVTRQVAAFFKKNSEFADASTCDLAASKSFFDAEKLCRITNKRLDYYSRHENRLEPELCTILDRMRSNIYMALGDIRSYASKVMEYAKVTSGATSNASRKNSLPHMKLRVRNLPCTPLAQRYIRAIANDLGFKKISFLDVVHNRVQTVPKNWKTNRTIACEPEGNLFLQLTVDGYLKTRLKALGCDLSDQSKNQGLARKGSIDGDFVTIDLSMASDTLSFNTVWFLFPFDWARYLSDIRSPCGFGLGREFTYCKFSSMGNGCTFTLETLVFLEACRAVGSTDHAVYGDDIVIRRCHYPSLLKVLRFLGFRVNQEKSFIDGPFRESCGGDFFNGTNVTPFYLREEPKLLPVLAHQVNGLAAVSLPGGRLWAYLRKIVHEKEIPIVPHSGSSTEGVWVDIRTAYSLGLIKSRKGQPWVPCYKGFVPKTRNLECFNIQTYTLWFLYAISRNKPYRADNFGYIPYNELQVCSNDLIIASSVALFSRRYRRKWVPVSYETGRVTPVHLYWWTEYLISSEAD